MVSLAKKLMVQKSKWTMVFKRKEKQVLLIFHKIYSMTIVDFLG